jgi:hypothetical protein
LEAASIVAVVKLSAKVASLCVQFSVAVKDTKTDIERLEKKVTNIKNVFEDVQKLFGQARQAAALHYTQGTGLTLSLFAKQTYFPMSDPSKGFTPRGIMQALRLPLGSNSSAMAVAYMEEETNGERQRP